MHRAQIDTQQILAFLAVAETGSFSAAARLIHITQPAISKRIALLEGLLGYPLFDRVARRVVLTEEGGNLLPAARSFRRSLDDLIDQAADCGGIMSGRLTLALSHYAGLHLLPPALRRFTSDYPDVRLDLTFLDSEDAIEAVRQGQASLAYATLPPRLGQSVIATPIWHERLVPMAAQSQLGDSKDDGVVRLEQLGTRLPVILPAAHTSTRQAIDHWLDQVNVLPPAVIEVNQLDSIALLTSTGVGWSVLPNTFLSDELHVIPQGSDIAYPCRTLGLVQRDNAHLPRLASAFQHMVKQTLGHGD